MILENGVGSAANHKCVMKENLFDNTDKTTGNLRLSWLSGCAIATGSATLLSCASLLSVCVELNPSSFYRLKHVSKLALVAIMGKSDVVTCYPNRAMALTDIASLFSELP